jgi:hypothetical protein
VRELLREGAKGLADLAFGRFDDAQLGLGDFALLGEGSDRGSRFARRIEGVLDRWTQDLLLPVPFFVRKAAEDEDESARGEGRVQ